MDDITGSVYSFEGFTLEAVERRLSHGEERVSLTPKVFDTLLLLVQRGGHVVRKDELMQAVWPDGFVEEVNLAYTISLLRKALAERIPSTTYIETVSKAGYRFIAPIKVSAQPPIVDRVTTTQPLTICLFNSPGLLAANASWPMSQPHCNPNGWLQ